MAWKPPKYSKRKTSQKINLRDLFGRAVDDSEKQQFAELALQRIKDRTQSNEKFTPRGRKGKFPRYSEKYAEQKGVDRNDVDLTLSETMLNSQRVIKQTRDTVEIGIDDERSAPISHNHNKGVTLPKRTFFGITKKEAQEIVNELQAEPTNTPPNKMAIQKKRRTIREELERLGGLEGN